MKIGRRPISVLICPRGQGGRGIRPYKDQWIDAPHGWTIENAARLARAGVPWSTVTLTTGITTTLFSGRDLLGLSEEDMRAVRGRDIAMIFQEPMTSLNPVLSIGRQITEPLLIHLKMSEEQARERADRRRGDKGGEAARAALQQAELYVRLREGRKPTVRGFRLS